MFNLLTVRSPRAPRGALLRRRLLRSTPSSKSTVVQADAPGTAPGLEHLFALSRDALVLIETASDRILRWNTAAEQLFGYAAHEVMGKSAHMLMPPPLARVHRERIAHYRRSGEAEVFGDRPLSVPATHRSGAELRVELSATPLEPADGTRSLVLLTFRDASCQQQAELSSLATARADAARHELQAQLHECERLLAETTRDIAEPVARVRRAAAHLARLACEAGSAETERVTRLAQVVEARTRDVEQTLLRITTTVAIQNGTFTLEADRVNLVPLIARIVGDFRTLAPAHRIKLGAPQGLTAICDAARVEAVVADVIQRAVRRNPRGCWIDIDLRRPLAGVAQIEVRDYGRRLTARERERLGSDRGWFINQHILEEHGGTLSLGLMPEGGVRVVLSVPAHRGKLLAR